MMKSNEKYDNKRGSSLRGADGAESGPVIRSAKMQGTPVLQDDFLNFFLDSFLT